MCSNHTAPTNLTFRFRTPTQAPLLNFGIAHLKVVGLRAFDANMRLVGEWNEMVQASNATYVTTLATPEPTTLTTLGIGVLAIALLRRR